MNLSQLDVELIALVRDHSVPAIIGMARIGAVFAWLPYLSTGVLPSKVLRSVMALVVLIGIWPVTENVAVPPDKLGMLIAVGMEALIGTAIGLMISLPFHIFHATGSLIDTQRGAGVGAMLNPTSGVEATELANLLQMLAAVVFLMSDGLVPLLEVIVGSYGLIPMGSAFVPDVAMLHSYGGLLISAALAMAAPVLLVMLLVEITLGVLSRFAQQMNAFSISLTVKSFLAFLVLLIYLMPAITHREAAPWRAVSPLEVLRPVLAP